MRTEGTLSRLKDGQGNPLQVPSPYADLAKFMTTQIPANEGAGADESFSIIGDFSQLLWCVRTEMRLEATRVEALRVLV